MAKKKESVASKLAEASTISQLYTIARELKSQGYDIEEVNKGLVKRRSELRAQLDNINSIEKVVAKASTTQNRKITSMQLVCSNLNNNVIMIMPDKIIF